MRRVTSVIPMMAPRSWPRVAVGSAALRQRHLPLVPVVVVGARRRRAVGAQGRAAGPARRRRHGATAPHPRPRRPPVARRRRRAPRRQPRLRPDRGAATRSTPCAPSCPAADIHELGPDDDLVDVLRDGLPARRHRRHRGRRRRRHAERGRRPSPSSTTTCSSPSRPARSTTSPATSASTRPEDADRRDPRRHGDPHGPRRGHPADGGETLRTFVNTLSFGGYTQVVDARERLQPRLGKWAGPRRRPGPRAAADGAARPRARRRADARVWLGLDRQRRATRPTGSPRRGASTSTTACSTCASCSATAASPAPASSLEVLVGRLRRSPGVPRGAGRASSTIVSTTARCAWPSTARRSTARRSFAVTKRRRALAVAVPPA